MAVKFSGSLFLRRIPNETLKRDESFIEIVWGRRRKLPARLQILRSTKFLLLPPEKAKRLVSQYSSFFFLNSKLSGAERRRDVNM